jgi:hypothetical protein
MVRLSLRLRIDGGTDVGRPCAMLDANEASSATVP